MKTDQFDYNLPKGLIAQKPLNNRDGSKLMIIDRDNKQISHHKFTDIINYLSKGDLIVWNNSKVFKARLIGTLMMDENTDGIDEQKIYSTDKILNASKIEIFLLRPSENFGVWKVLAKPGRKLRLGMKVVFADDFFCEIMLREKDGTFLVEFSDDDMTVRSKANKYGQVPIPPYINNDKNSIDKLDIKYQTVYAKKEGSVAAPTAGFHFTNELIELLKEKEVEFAEVTLHVGIGTFQPVKTENIEEHKMHSEQVEITASNCELINDAKRSGRRIIAVGTTTVRTLEGIYNQEGSIKPYSGDINLFITPGFKFNVIDALITNFHLPKSTLLMLVSAFVGDREYLLDCYQQAIEKEYRFFSFGDAMLIK